MSNERPAITEEITIEGASRRPHLQPLGLASVGQPRVKPAALSSRDFALIGCAIAFVAALGLLYLLQSAEVTRIAYRVSDRRAEVERLTAENSVLEAEILTLTQLNRIEARAQALGLGTPERVLYVGLDADAGASASADTSAPAEDAHGE